MNTHTRKRSRTPAVHPLRKARLKACLTQQQVADRIGVTKAAVSSWETSQRYPLREQAVRIQVLFPKVTLEQLYTYPRAA